MVAGPLSGKAVVAKLGMDAHWRGVIVVAHALRDAGMEVVYLGHATPDQLVSAVVQEDPALVGLSSLSGNHLEECRTVLDGLRMAGVDGVAVVIGGTIPPVRRTGPGRDGRSRRLRLRLAAAHHRRPDRRTARRLSAVPGFIWDTRLSETNAGRSFGQPLTHSL